MSSEEKSTNGVMISNLDVFHERANHEDGLLISRLNLFLRLNAFLR